MMLPWASLRRPWVSTLAPPAPAAEPGLRALANVCSYLRSVFCKTHTNARSKHLLYSFFLHRVTMQVFLPCQPGRL